MKQTGVLVPLLAAILGAGPVVTTIPAASADTLTTPTVVSIRAAHHPGYDRVVFQMTSLPSQRSVRYVTQVLSDPKGSVVAVSGRYFAVLRLFPATAFTTSGVATPARLTPGLPNLWQIVRVGDFEGVLSYAFGLQQRVPIRVFTLNSPPRVVADIPVLTWPGLVSGSRGMNVTAAQYLLRARGYRLTVNGVFDAATRAAAIAFERATLLPLNGTIGAREWPRLVMTVRYGSTGNAVRALQVELRKNGYGVAVDGALGPLTLTAVKSAQKANALLVDGIAGPMTWMTLVCRNNGG
jgi:hypothetical protein